MVVSYTDWTEHSLPISQVVVCDGEYNPLPDALRESSPGRGILNTDVYKHFTFLIWCNVKGFGRMKLYADNGGKGYTQENSRLDLNYELTKSRAVNVRARINAGHVPMTAYSPETISRLQDAESLLAAAESAKRPNYRLSLLENSLSASMWAGEMAVLDEARARIAATPRRLSFKFGAAAYKYGQGFPNYEDRFLELFNYATVPFYLKSYEPEEGQPRPERNKEVVAWLVEHGLEVKGHPLVWLFQGTQPEWASAKSSYETMRELIRNRILRDVGFWKDRIHIWDVINEAHDWANCYGYNSDEMIELTRLACESTKEADPGALRIVNLCYLTAEYAAGNRNANIEVTNRMMTPYQYAKRIIREEPIDFEILGLQLYYPSLDLFELTRLLDRYAALGKPIHITEIAAPSSPEGDPLAHIEGPDAVRNMGEWHRPWDPDLQAEWLEGIYTIAYAHPGVHAITYWDFGDYDRHFFPHGGLLDTKGQAKPAFYRLRTLFKKWGVGPYQAGWVPDLAPAVPSATSTAY